MLFVFYFQLLFICNTFSFDIGVKWQPLGNEIISMYCGPPGFYLQLIIPWTYWNKHWSSKVGFILCMTIHGTNLLAKQLTWVQHWIYFSMLVACIPSNVFGNTGIYYFSGQYLLFFPERLRLILFRHFHGVRFKLLDSRET